MEAAGRIWSWVLQTCFGGCWWWDAPKGSGFSLHTHRAWGTPAARGSPAHPFGAGCTGAGLEQPRCHWQARAGQGPTSLLARGSSPACTGFVRAAAWCSACPSAPTPELHLLPAACSITPTPNQLPESKPSRSNWFCCFQKLNKTRLFQASPGASFIFTLSRFKALDWLRQAGIFSPGRVVISSPLAQGGWEGCWGLLFFQGVYNRNYTVVLGKTR